MILRYNHIELKLINESLIELLRVWRNSSGINQFMDHQAKISKEQQLVWFLNLSKENNFYFIIYSENKPIGMIHLSKIKDGEAESGMFIAENEFQGTGVAFTASMLLLDFAFETLKLEGISAKIKNDNKTAQDYNRLLGFRLDSQISDSFSNWILKKVDYTEKREFLRKLLN